MLLALLLLAQNASTVETALAEYRAKTAADVPCRTTSDPEEIVVCARRESYRYQLPLVRAYNARNDAHAQEALIETREAQGIAECGQGAFLVKCGSVGVSVSIGLGGGPVRYIERPVPK